MLTATGGNNPNGTQEVECQTCFPFVTFLDASTTMVDIEPAESLKHPNAAPSTVPYSNSTSSYIYSTNTATSPLHFDDESGTLLTQSCVSSTRETQTYFANNVAQQTGTSMSEYLVDATTSTTHHFMYNDVGNQVDVNGDVGNANEDDDDRNDIFEVGKLNQGHMHHQHVSAALYNRNGGDDFIIDD